MLATNASLARDAASACLSAPSSLPFASSSSAVRTRTRDSRSSLSLRIRSSASWRRLTSRNMQVTTVRSLSGTGFKFISSQKLVPSLRRPWIVSIPWLMNVRLLPVPSSWLGMAPGFLTSRVTGLPIISSDVYPNIRAAARFASSINPAELVITTPSPATRRIVS